MKFTQNVKKKSPNNSLNLIKPLKSMNFMAIVFNVGGSSLWNMKERSVFVRTHFRYVWPIPLAFPKYLSHCTISSFEIFVFHLSSSSCPIISGVAICITSSTKSQRHPLALYLLSHHLGSQTGSESIWFDLIQFKWRSPENRKMVIFFTFDNVPLHFTEMHMAVFWRLV